MQGELPIPTDVSPLTDSLYRSDMDENERRELDDDQSFVEEETQAYKALAADRRGLSDELVRLHNELADSHADRCELKQQVMDLVSVPVKRIVEFHCSFVFGLLASLLFRFRIHFRKKSLSAKRWNFSAKQPFLHVHRNNGYWLNMKH